MKFGIIKFNKGQLEILYLILVATIILSVVGGLFSLLSQQSKINKLEIDLSNCKTDLNNAISANSDLNQKYEYCQKALTDNSEIKQVIADLPKDRLILDIVGAIILIFMIVVVVKPALFKIQCSMIVEKVEDFFDNAPGWVKFIVKLIFIAAIILFILYLITNIATNVKLILFKV